MENTSNNVKIQLDTGWQLYGGDDIVAFMQKYADRIVSVHLKDIIPEYADTAKNDIFTAVGKGVLPTADILNVLPLNMIEHGLMIDQDGSAKDSYLLDDLKIGALYLKNMVN